MKQVLLVTGFLGAGKTTLINALLPEMLRQNRVAIIENEFGQVGIDTPLLAKGSVEIRELLSGCICCTLQGEMIEALRLLLAREDLNWILIEPSGVSQTSDLMRALALAGVAAEQVKVLNLIDCENFEEQADTFAGFFTDQIACAGLHLLSHTEGLPADAVSRVAALVGTYTPRPVPVTREMEGHALWQLVQEMDAGKDWAIPADDRPRAPLLLEAWTAHDPAPKTEGAAAAAVAAALERGGEKIWRLKGFLPMAAGGRLHADHKLGTTRFKRIEGLEEKGLVVIGQALDREMLESLFMERAAPHPLPARGCGQRGS